MASQSVLEILIQLKDEASEKMKKFSNSFGAAEGASKTFGIGILAAGAGAVAFGVSAVKAAGEAEAQLASMNATLATMGTKGTDAKEAILKMSESAVKLGFDDEDAAVSIAKLYQRTGDLTQAGYLNATAMDLARAKHMDLTTAGNLVGLVLSGNGRLLKQYGIDLKDSATPMEAILELHDKLAGQANAYASTWEGNMAILSVVFGNLKETVGQYILPLLTSFLQKGIIPLIEKFGVWSSDIRNINNWLNDHKTVLYLVVGAIVGALTPALWGMATAATAAAWGMITALWPFALIGAAIAGLVLSILWVTKNWDLIKEKTLEVWNTISEFLGGIWNGIKDTISTIWNGIKDFFSTIWEGIKTIFTFAAQLAVGIVIGIFAAFGIDIVAVFDKMKLYFSLVWNAIKLVFSTSLDLIKKTWNSVWDSIVNFIGPIWDTIKTTIIDGWNNIVAKFTEFAEPLNKAWNNLWSGVGQTLTEVWKGVEQTIKNSINWILEKINTVISAMNSVSSKGASALGIKAIQIPTIPLLAEGGIVNSPTLAMIGEAGPEAVIPLSRMNNFGSGTTINITITGNNINSKLDIRNLADQVSGAIMGKLRLNARV